MEETRQQQQEDEEDEEENIVKRFSDKEWPRQWYLNRGGDLDMNVEEAWDLGYSGKGITVTILDDGVEWNHPDLSANYKEEASYDINANDKDPFPRSEQLIDTTPSPNIQIGDSHERHLLDHREKQSVQAAPVGSFYVPGCNFI